MFKRTLPEVTQYENNMKLSDQGQDHCRPSKVSKVLPIFRSKNCPLTQLCYNLGGLILYEAFISSDTNL